ncbi:LON peptidase N-terminal domain and RING finger protein 1 isoform X2 [Aricia agestis]|uniref:LON peptidase N-terminal domain and RING finger protein 1 isoform X2 n=1 Tax=Aricia agestis TaxID=91739 RepID=UPI001C202374|nr:LON peptidase N-terminal domain and RING finger protein 1 isoform X2 [Aricia agestis]
MLPVSGIGIPQGNTSAVNVPYTDTYWMPRCHYNQINGLIRDNYCQTEQRFPAVIQRIEAYRMANQNDTNILRRPVLQEENRSTAVIQGQSSYTNLDKRQESDSRIEIIDISEANNTLAIRNIPSANNEYINERLSDIDPHLSVTSENFEASERLSETELLTAMESQSISDLESKYAISVDENSLLPSTLHQSWDDQMRKAMHKVHCTQISGNKAIRVSRMANKLIKLSRCLKTPNVDEISCLSCRRIPVAPVTGKCGHTRCMRCTFTHKVCPCGAKAPDVLSENTKLREIIEKMMKYVKRLKLPKNPLSITAQEVKLASTLELHASMRICQRRSLNTRGALQNILRPRIPMSPQARYKKARELISAGLYTEAATQLARAAASTEPCARFARRLLTKTLILIYQDRGQKDASKELSFSIREQSIQSWLQPADLECVLCTNPYREPVSTPCGHTFCRCCIERSMYYRRKCALCSGSLDNFSLAETSNNLFFTSILNCMDVPPLPIEPDVIPIVISYVTFPGLPCPLFIKNSRHWQMILRVLRSGSRRFGMLSYERDHTLADYGMVLEICDCVVFEDNRCIVSTVGISRFKVVERDVRDGCDVARIRQLVDIAPTKEEVCNILMLTETIASKALTWLENMKENVRDEIETAFGSWPIWHETQKEWWNTPDGPAWLWWLIAILPLTKGAKVNILSTPSLLARMLAVLRTFEIMAGSLI